MSFQSTSTSSFVQKRLSMIRLRSLRWSRLNASVSRGSVADTRLIGTVTRPKLIAPFHKTRGGMAVHVATDIENFPPHDDEIFWVPRDTLRREGVRLIVKFRACASNVHGHAQRAIGNSRTNTKCVGK